MQTMQLTNKRISKIKATYTLEGTVLESIKYLGVTITNDLKWNTHITNVCTKANRTLVYLSTLYTVDATEYVTAQIDATFHEVSEECKTVS